MAKVYRQRLSELSSTLQVLRFYIILNSWLSLFFQKFITVGRGNSHLSVSVLAKGAGPIIVVELG